MGSVEDIEWVKTVQGKLRKDPVFINDSSLYDLEREEMMHQGYKRLNRLLYKKYDNLTY